MKKNRILRKLAVPVFITVCGCNHVQDPASISSLKEALKGEFVFGVALNTAQLLGRDTAALKIVEHHFNSVVGENCMKSEIIQPEEGKFDFSLSDKLVDYAKQHGMTVIGHALIWHSQAPAWFFTDDRGNTVSREVLIGRMKSHINTLVSRYKGRVDGWDAVNEAIEDDGSWRQSPFYQIIGKDYVRLAFQFAREADPDAGLYYNDYSMANPGRRAGVVRMVKELQDQGIRVDGIGMQCHVTMDYPTLDEYEKSILAFAALDVPVMITEMDITVLPFPGDNAGADVSLRLESDPAWNPYAGGLPDSVAVALHDRYAGFFALFLKHQDKINRVTIWGVTDGQSWRNYWPIHGRTDYPLLFDRNYQPEPIDQTSSNLATATKNE